MQRLIHTPKMKRSAWLLALLAVFAQPLVEFVYYSTNLQRGAYPADADSIAIPILHYVFGWLLFLPVELAFVWFTLREYPGSVSLFAHNAGRPIWSLLWSAAILLMAASYIWFAFQSIWRGFPVDVAAALLLTYVLLCLRSSVVYSSAFWRRLQATRSM